MSKKNEMKLERRRLRKAARTKRLLWLGVSVAVIIFLVALAQYWPRPAPPTTQQEKFVGIQHALLNENDTEIGNPSPGYVFADFSVRIMNCGYMGFPVAPSLFDLVIGDRTYKASDATAQLQKPLGQTTVEDGQTVDGQLAYEIPAGSTIPETPLVYTGEGFEITWTNAW